MRKRVAVLTVMVVFLLTMTATAVTTTTVAPRGVIVTPLLSYNGTTAICEVLASGNTADEVIYAAVKLMHGNEVIESWYPSATGILDFSETAEVTRGETYTLTVRVYTINAPNLPEVSVSGKCE